MEDIDLHQEQVKMSNKYHDNPQNENKSLFRCDSIRRSYLIIIEMIMFDEHFYDHNYQFFLKFKSIRMRIILIRTKIKANFKDERSFRILLGGNRFNVRSTSNRTCP